jgi:S-DNA-T family DNA segregation ATPase FtsK/SpoIIIE
MSPIQRALTPTRNRRLNEFVGVLLLAAAGLLLLALVSYHPADPSWDTAAPFGAGRAARNWAGVFGSYTSDLLFQFVGVAAFCLPLLLASAGIAWLRSTAVKAPGLKLAGAVLYLLCAPAAIGLLPGHLRWLGALPVEGVFGRVFVDLLTGYLNAPGAAVAILTGLAVATMLSTAFSFNAARQWLAIRLAFVIAWRDRFRNWRKRRARKQGERATAATRTRKPVSQAAVRQPGGSALGWFSRLWRNHPYRQPHAVEGEAVQEGAAGDLIVPRRTVREGVPARVQRAPVPAAPSLWEAMPRTGEGASEPRRRGIDRAFEDDAEAEPVTPKRAPQPEPARTPAPEADEPIYEPAASFLPESDAGPQSISIGERADADTPHVTLTPRAVSGFRLPPSTLLHKSEVAQTIREDALRDEARVLVEKCAEFDVRGQVTHINPGPVVTTFEFRPEAGVKYSRVTGLADDLCLAMAAESILIERMAGKSTVGIQVPNAERETIWLRDIVESDILVSSKMRLPLAMGKDINGRIVAADLAAMPHVLIAGSTGSGKSVAINAMIMSVLFKTTPEQVRLILVDPKRVELGMYEGIPHLFTPIITEPKLAANALRNAVREMERRLKLLASKSVRNLDQYNKLFENPSLFEDDPEARPLPYIVIIIDELADLMMLDKANVEEAITRLAQMARAVGIHLILATQRPSVDVITGLIKANVPTRISFRLATKVDSRTILDNNGAESLLGRGDMLFLPPGTSRLQRVHAPFVTEKEIAAVVDFWKTQGAAEYAEGFLESPRDEKGRELSAEDGEQDEDDPLFDDAVRLVFEFGKASTSLLQRRLRIGYGRAAHLIDLMEKDGLVGPAETSKPRELLKSPDWVSEVQGSLR